MIGLVSLNQLSPRVAPGGLFETHKEIVKWQFEMQNFGRYESSVGYQWQQPSAVDVIKVFRIVRLLESPIVGIVGRCAREPRR